MAWRSATKCNDPVVGPPLKRYWAGTHAPLNCLAFVGPLIGLYEVGVAVTTDTDLLARMHLQRVLRELGATAAHLPAALVIVVLLAWHVRRRAPWRIRGRVVVGMYFESVLVALPLLGIGLLTQRLVLPAVAAAGAARGAGFWNQLLIGVGAGVYEEFVFRLAGLSLLGLVLVDVLELRRDLAALLAVAASAALFAWYHFPGVGAVAWTDFVFFFLAGCYLAGVYLVRGFGVAVGAHISYNLIISLIRELARAGA